MSEMEEKLGAILGNPQLMQQIMSMAQSINQPRTEEPPPAPSQAGFDPGLLQALSGMARNTGPDQREQGLLKALSPYLSRGRIAKLEKAMRSARLAQMASAFIHSGGLQMLSGR